MDPSTFINKLKIMRAQELTAAENEDTTNLKCSWSSTQGIQLAHAHPQQTFDAGDDEMTESGGACCGTPRSVSFVKCSLVAPWMCASLHLCPGDLRSKSEVVDLATIYCAALNQVKAVLRVLILWKKSSRSVGL